jgi:hypothetical protein
VSGPFNNCHRRDMIPNQFTLAATIFACHRALLAVSELALECAPLTPTPIIIKTPLWRTQQFIAQLTVTQSKLWLQSGMLSLKSTQIVFKEPYDQ